MLIQVFKSKIHRATVTQADLNYVGSVTIDENLMDASGLFENERVQVVNINNGERLETYVIKGKEELAQYASMDQLLAKYMWAIWSSSSDIVC